MCRAVSRRARPGLRSYAPRLGRWLSRDPIEEIGFSSRFLAKTGRDFAAEKTACNPLLFVANCPVNHLDRLGLKMVGSDCYAWYNQCTKEALEEQQGCADAISVGKVFTVCLASCGGWALKTKSTWVFVGCMAACGGADTIAFAYEWLTCLSAKSSRLKGCSDGFTKCKDHLCEGKPDDWVFQ